MWFLFYITEHCSYNPDAKSASNFTRQLITNMKHESLLGEGSVGIGEGGGGGGYEGA